MISVLDNEQMAELVAAVATGDRVAFARLFDHFAPRIAAVHGQGGMSPENAEELAQEAMVVLWRKSASFDPARGSVSAWMLTIARNLRVDRARREAHAVAGFVFDPIGPRDDVRRPDDALHARQLDRRVRAAMGHLPAAHARALRMFYFAERPHPDIARDLALPLGTVKSQIRQALERLRRLLDVPNA